MSDQRFVLSLGTISIANGAAVVTGVGTAFNGRDLAAAELWVTPRAGQGTIGGVAATNAAAFRVGWVAEVDPQGIYQPLELPLISTYYGPALIAVNYELRYGPGIARQAALTQAQERLYSMLQYDAGLVTHEDDIIDTAQLPNNSLRVSATRRLSMWRNGDFEDVEVIGAQWTPRGLWNGATTYAKNDLLESGGKMFVSNVAGNLNHQPQFSGATPLSNAYWTVVPFPTVQDVLDALGIHKITVSTSAPSGGVDGDVHFKVQ